MTLLDREFISSRQRRLSLAIRLPNVLAPDNLDNVLVARWGGKLCASVSLRIFAWQADDRQWRGAMAGLVCTDPDYRGRGLAAALLRAVPGLLRERSVDFGVLWTSIPAFYEPFGWQTNDRGLLGHGAGLSPRSTTAILPAQTMAAVDPDWLESVRAAWRVCRVRREARDYTVIPPSCDRVRCFAVKGPGADEGYALVGERPDIGLVYELVGAPSALPHLWQSIRFRYPRLYVNDCLDDPATEWLRREQELSWEPQRQAMWLGISRDFACSSWRRWHISFFDRV